jgi:hypothetical protein
MKDPYLYVGTETLMFCLYFTYLFVSSLIINLLICNIV